MLGIFITARLGSTRLSQKHLIQVNGKTFIEWLVKRFESEFSREIDSGEAKIFITTSAMEENKKFEELFKDDSVGVFYGSDENIPLRHLQCAEKNKIDYIISIDGDDILCSTHAARLVGEMLKNNNAMSQTQGLPLGMNVMGYSRDFLSASLASSRLNKLETGWGKIFDKDKINTISIESKSSSAELRMTLDYQLDADFFSEVIASYKEDIIDVPDEELINKIIDSGWYKLNNSLNEEYWTNFNKQKQEEN